MRRVLPLTGGAGAVKPATFLRMPLEGAITGMCRTEATTRGARVGAPPLAIGQGPPLATPPRTGAALGRGGTGSVQPHQEVHGC